MNNEKKQQKSWLSRARLSYNRSLVNKFFAGLETRGGIIGDRAVLFCYNAEQPELSYIITEQL